VPVLMKMSLVVRLLQVIQPFLRLCVFNELAVFSEEKKIGRTLREQRIKDHPSSQAKQRAPHVATTTGQLVIGAGSSRRRSISTTTCPFWMPIARAADTSCTSSTYCTSRK
jgi:hypothetical protein